MQTDNPTLPAAAATADTEPYLLVKLAAGKYAVAGATDLALGSTQRRVKADETVAPRRPSAGTMRLTASGAVTVATEVVQDAGGKIKSRPAAGGGTAILVGVALEAATADGDVIDVEPRGFGTVVTIPA